MPDSDFRRKPAQQLRVDSVRASAAAGSGHPTSSMSAADIIAVLLDGYLTLDFQRPDDPRNDHLIFSKGHASPLYYAILKVAGAITDDELLTYRSFGSRLEGHPTPRIPPTDVATGSLGQGLPIGVGVALTGKKLDQLPHRVWVPCGDSEMAEGSMGEALQYAASAQLDNLTAIVDVNRSGQTRETMLGWDLDSYASRVRAFGWHPIIVDGHDVDGAVSIGEDGPWQMALEDMAALRAVHGSTVLHPSDANQTARRVAEMADRSGISYLRTLRGKTELRTPADEEVRIGGSWVLWATDHDHVTIIACGITVAEADKAADALAAEGIRARVIDCYSIKPIDEAALATAADQTSGIITVEDHWPQGGLGAAVLSALVAHPDRPPVHMLAVGDMPMSGKPAELLHAAGIDAEAITTAARELLSQHSVTSAS